MAATLSYGEAELEEEGSKSMVLTTHTIMKVSLRLERCRGKCFAPAIRYLLHFFFKGSESIGLRTMDDEYCHPRS